MLIISDTFIIIAIFITHNINGIYELSLNVLSSQGKNPTCFNRQIFDIS